MFLTLMTPLLPLQSWVSWFHLPWPSKGAACQDRNCWRRRLTSITQKLIITAFFRIEIIPESCSKQGHFTEGTSIIYPLGAGGFCLCDDKFLPDLPRRLCDILLISSPPHPPHQQLIGRQFSKSLFMAITDLLTVPLHTMWSPPTPPFVVPYLNGS